MAPEADETFTRKEIQQRFEKLFKRPMTAEERSCFFLPPAAENEKAVDEGQDDPRSHPSTLQPGNPHLCRWHGYALGAPRCSPIGGR
jgi:hypothetical protein